CRYRQGFKECERLPTSLQKRPSGRFLVLGRSPGPITFLVRHGTIKATGNWRVAQYLGGTDFRGEEAKQGELFDHGEVVRRSTACGVCARFLIKLGDKSRTLSWSQRHKATVVGFAALDFK